LLWACAPTPAPTAPIEPATVEHEERRPASIVDARPLDPEIAALLTPELLAAGESDPSAPDTRTPAERARDICQAFCEREFDRDRLIRRMLEASLRAESVDSVDLPHGLPPDLSDEDGMRRFIDGERSTLWWWSYALFINPIPERVDFRFHGTQIEIDEHNRVLRCRHVDRDDPAMTIDVTCSQSTMTGPS
jgi:hypothetical protein